MKKIKNILILAGGDSTRFWPLKNKTLYSFMGRPLLQHVVESVKQYGEKIFVVTGETNRSAIKEMDSSLEILIQREDKKGMADAVLSTKNFISGDVLILNANDVFDPKILETVVSKNASENAELTFVARKMNTYFPGGYLKFSKDGILEGIVEKPAPDKTPSNLVNLVVDYFRDAKKWIAMLEETGIIADDSYEHALTAFIKKYKTNYVTYDSYWFTLKYPWHVLPMMSHFLQSLNNEVKFGKNVKIASTAKIVGPCYIGDNTTIGDFALVRQSQIGQDSTIGGYSEVTRSYLGNSVSLHRNYVGDSVLADGVHFGAEATTANFRFDAKTISSSANGTKVDTNLDKFGTIIGLGSKIGVNTTILPGIKIGANTFIAPGHTIAEDVEDNMFVKKKKVANLHHK